MAVAAQDAIKDESITDMFASIARDAQKWNTISDIAIMQCKARLNHMFQSLVNEYSGPLDIMQCNLQPYPPIYMCKMYLDDDEARYFTTRAPFVLPDDISNDNIVAMFSEISISFMLENRHDESQVRFIKIYQQHGNFHIVIDSERWENDAMDCDDDIDDDAGDAKNDRVANDNEDNGDDNEARDNENQNEDDNEDEDEDDDEEEAMERVRILVNNE